MPGPPPPLGNGFVWICHTLLSAEQARLLERRLLGLRHEYRTRDHAGLGHPAHDTGVEVWAHPDDRGRALAALHDVLAGG